MGFRGRGHRSSTAAIAGAHHSLLGRVTRGCLTGACVLGGSLGLTVATAWALGAGRATTTTYPDRLVVSEVFRPSTGPSEPLAAAISLSPVPPPEWAPDSSSSPSTELTQTISVVVRSAHEVQPPKPLHPGKPHQSPKPLHPGKPGPPHRSHEHAKR